MDELKPSELRIGNFVRSTLVVLDAITKEDLTSFIDRRIKNGNEIDNAHWFQPIVISEAWMTRLEFKMVLTKGGYYFKRDEDYRLSIIDGILHVSVGEDQLGVLLVKLKYVHELQNLYFALTKIDL